MFTRRNFMKLGAAGVGALSLSCLSTPALASRQGGTLRVAIVADPLSFDPHLTGNVQGRAAVQAIHDTLLGISETGELTPRLVESWEQPNGTTYILHLRRGVKFHDGTPFDAEAVIYNINRILNPDTASIRAGEIKALDTIEAVDSHTLRLTLKYPFSAFLYPFTDVTGCIGSPAAFEAHGTRLAGLSPVGTGPFKLANYSQDNETVLERNPDYWDEGKPYLDRIILKPIPTDTTRLTEIETGSVDIAEGLPLQSIAALRRKDSIAVSESIGFSWEYIGFNAGEGFPGANKKLRQAFQWLIDREALHQAAYFGTGSVGYSGILPGNPYHDPDYAPFTYDPDQAKRLLDESGLGSAEITARLRPEPVKQRAAQLVQAMAADVGIKINLEQTDYAGYRAMLRAGELPMDMQGWWGYRPDPDQYLSILLASDGSYAKFHGYSNPQMDELFAKQREATDHADRRQYFDAITELMNEDAIYVPWHYSSDFKGLAPRVQGFQHAPSSIIDYRGIHLAS